MSVRRDGLHRAAGIGEEIPAAMEHAAMHVWPERGFQGARLVALPENFYLVGRQESDKVKVRERDGGGPIQDFLAQAARRHGA